MNPDDFMDITIPINIVIPVDWRGQCVNYRFHIGWHAWVGDDGSVLGCERIPGDYPRVKCGRTLRRVHVMVLAVWHGHKPSVKHKARHLNGDPQDCRASNLRWGTHAENVADWRYHRALERHGLTRDLVPYERREA